MTEAITSDSAGPHVSERLDTLCKKTEPTTDQPPEADNMVASDERITAWLPGPLADGYIGELSAQC